MKKSIAEYLGTPSFTLLFDEPFKLWEHERSIEESLDEPIVHYVFPKHGLELRCDADENISVIFLFCDSLSGFDLSFLEIAISSNQQQVRKFFGSPSKSGEACKDPILDEYGPLT
jgi:hypothetical protein